MVDERPQSHPPGEGPPEPDATPDSAAAPEAAAVEESRTPDQPRPDEHLVATPDTSNVTPEGAAAPPRDGESSAGLDAAEPVPEAVADAPASLPPADGPANPPSRRRLMRSRDHHIIGGVAGGLAERLDTDPGVVRVLFLVLALFTAGIAIAVYVVLWVVTPLEPAGTSDASERAQHRSTGDRQMGGLVFGLLLVVAGVTWLLEATNSVDVDWSVVLAITLIGLGALLVLTLGSVARGLLLPLGVLLTVALAVVSLVDINFESSFGNRSEEPVSAAELQREYSHAFGSMTLDLSSLELQDGTTNVKASTSFGSLEVILPAGVPVRVEAKTTFGSVDALDQEANGLRADRTVRTDDYDHATKRINLQVNASFGAVEVHR